ncbi:MAG: ATP-dependent Clp protease proteolytic subunit [Stellaceae bacterium]
MPNRDVPVEITINSEGGDVLAALHIADAIATHRAGCTTVVPAGAVCFSAACVVFSAARERRAHVDSRFLIHATGWAPGEPGRWTAEDHRTRAAHLAAIDDGMFAALARACNRSVEQIMAVASENEISALTAADLGLVTFVEW